MIHFMIFTECKWLFITALQNILKLDSLYSGVIKQIIYIVMFSITIDYMVCGHTEDLCSHTEGLCGETEGP